MMPGGLGGPVSPKPPAPVVTSGANRDQPPVRAWGPHSAPLRPRYWANPEQICARGVRVQQDARQHGQPVGASSFPERLGRFVVCLLSRYADVIEQPVIEFRQGVSLPGSFRTPGTPKQYPCAPEQR